jgi:hypothetical protein
MVVGHTHSIVDQFFHAPAVLPLPDLPPRPPLIVTNRSSVKVFYFLLLYILFLMSLDGMLQKNIIGWREKK